MIGPRYWSTGITLTCFPGAGWGASLKFFDDGYAQNGSTVGELRVQYRMRDPAEAIDLLRADAERLGIEWRLGPTIYIADDDDPRPADWREIVIAQAKRLGWRSVYDRGAEMQTKPEGGAR